jgi:hypothetical protein
VWVERGFNNTMKKEVILESINYPKWFGDEKFHDSHKSNLLKKDPIFYSKYNWNVNPNNPYIWQDSEGKWYEQYSGKKGRIYLN